MTDTGEIDDANHTVHVQETDVDLGTEITKEGGTTNAVGAGVETGVTDTEIVEAAAEIGEVAVKKAEVTEKEVKIEVEAENTVIVKITVVETEVEVQVLRPPSSLETRSSNPVQVLEGRHLTSL